MRAPAAHRARRGFFSFALRTLPMLAACAFLGASGCGDRSSVDAGATLPTVVVTPETPVISSGEIRRLRQRLVNQQTREKRELKKGQDDALRALNQSQRAIYKDWSAKEKELRRKYFSDNPKGDVRRAYVKDFLHRRETLVQAQKEEMAALKRKHDSETTTLETAAKDKRLEAEAYFREKRKPSFLPIDG